MSTARKSEKQVRIEILKQALELGERQTANYFHEPESSVARELVREKLVTGSAKEVGAVGVTGIRDAGRDYLKAQQPIQKFLRGLKFLVASLSIAAVIRYVANLDSVRAFLPDFVSRPLK